MPEIAAGYVPVEFIPVRDGLVGVILRLNERERFPDRRERVRDVASERYWVHGYRLVRMG